MTKQPKPTRMKVLPSADDINQALKHLGNPAQKAEALVFTATNAYLNLVNGGSVNNFVLVDEDYLDYLKNKAL